MKPLKKLSHSKVHFIGIGGIGMCGLAELLFNMGAQVTGSDLNENAQTQRLVDLGIKIGQGHDADQLGDAEVVVYSSAIPPSNCEFQAARERHIPLIARAEALAEIMRLKRGLAIAGTHGKTTTTSLTASVFLESGMDPTLVVGGRLDLIKSTAQLGAGEWLVAEADESDGSFSRLSPEVVVITNIDNDHLDHYKSFDALKTAFFEFAARIPFYGSAIVCGDDANLREIFTDFPKRVVFYGFDKTNHFWLEGEKGNYRVFQAETCLGDLRVPLPGKYNALNALAAIVSGLEAGVGFEVACRGIESFPGVERRFQLKAEKRGILYYDDYGHHPTEVKCVLAAFKEKYPDKRLVVLFQPHRYSRSQSCWSEFLESFNDCDELYVMDIYPAGESPIEGISAQHMVEEIKGVSSHYVPSKEKAIAEVQSQLQSGDVFLTLGAGDVWRLGHQIGEF